VRELKLQEGERRMIEDFLKDLLAMHRAVKPEIIQTHEPEEPLKEGEQEIGILPQDLQEWYAVRSAILCEHNAIYESIAEAAKEKDDKIVECDSILHHDIDKFMTELWNLGIRTAFRKLAVLPAGCEIIICQGWQVVLRRKPREAHGDVNLREARWGADRPLECLPSDETQS